MALLRRSLLLFGSATCSPTPTVPPRNHKIGLRSELSFGEFPSTALLRSKSPQWRGGLGVDLSLSRKSLALNKGFSICPLTVLRLKGQRLEFKLLEVAEDEEADEFIIGLPMGKRRPNRTRFVV